MGEFDWPKVGEFEVAIGDLHSEQVAIPAKAGGAELARPPLSRPACYEAASP